MAAFKYSLTACTLLTISGCNNFSSNPDLLEQARNELAQAQADTRVERLAPMDLQRAEESLQRAERFAQYFGTGKDTEHFAYLSQRYSQIALEHAHEAAIKEEIAKKQKRLQQLEQTLKEARLLQKDAWLSNQMLAQLGEETERGLVMTLNDVLFDIEGAKLRPAARLSVLKLAQFLKLNPKRRVRIEGYSDNRGSEEGNLALSRSRAQSVAETLEDLGIAKERLETQGYGQEFPIADNASSRGRAQNRRVEIVFSDASGQISQAR